METDIEDCSNEELSIDIFTVQEVPVFSSDDEIDDPLHHLPVVNHHSTTRSLYVYI